MFVNYFIQHCVWEDVKADWIELRAHGAIENKVLNPDTLWCESKADHVMDKKGEDGAKHWELQVKKARKKKNMPGDAQVGVNKPLYWICGQVINDLS